MKALFWVAVGCFGMFTLLSCTGSPKGTSDRMDDRVVQSDETQFRPMPGSTPSQRDLEILAMLKKEGADLSKPRHALFYFYFGAGDQAEGLRKELAKGSLAKEKAFKAKVEQREKEWVCIAEAEMVIDAKVLAKLRPELEAATARWKGEFDGWECAAVP